MEYATVSVSQSVFALKAFFPNRIFTLKKRFKFTCELKGAFLHDGNVSFFFEKIKHRLPDLAEGVVSTAEGYSVVFQKKGNLIAIKTYNNNDTTQRNGGYGESCAAFS